MSIVGTCRDYSYKHALKAKPTDSIAKQMPGLDSLAVLGVMSKRRRFSLAQRFAKSRRDLREPRILGILKGSWGSS